MRENVGDGLHVEREAAYGLWAYEGGIETESKRAGRAFRSVRGVNRQFRQKLNPQNPPGLPGGQSVSTTSPLHTKDWTMLTFPFVVTFTLLMMLPYCMVRSLRLLC